MESFSNMSQAKSLVAGSKNQLYNMKYEIASELHINVPQGTTWGDVSSRDCGRVGGNMTKKLVAMGKQHMAE